MLIQKGINMKSNAWYIMFPNDVYAMGPIRFENPVDETEVRKWTKNWAKVKKLPNGFSCWITRD